MKKIGILICFIFCLSAAHGQLGAGEELIERPQDTIPAKLERGILQTFKVIFSGEPGKVAAYGLLIPAGGQIYNKRYWKVPIVLAADAGAVYWYVYNRTLCQRYQTAYELFLAGDIDNYRGISNAESLRLLRNQYLLDSERAGITVIVIHLISMIEAFTDAHLTNFDISEDLSFELKSFPSPAYGQISGIGISYTF